MKKGKPDKKDVELSLATQGVNSPFFYGWLESQLRRCSKVWPGNYLIYSIKPSQFITGQTKKKNYKKQMWHWQCDGCSRWFPKSCLNVDHIVPVGAKLAGGKDLERYTSALFSQLNNAQLLCSYTLKDWRYDTPSCHYRKTYQK